MLSIDREFHYSGEATLIKSRVIKEAYSPSDDKVNWLFLSINKKQFSFVYKIDAPSKAEYGKPFKIYLAFSAIEDVENKILLNHVYPVLRGQEDIGTVILRERI